MTNFLFTSAACLASTKLFPTTSNPIQSYLSYFLRRLITTTLSAEDIICENPEQMHTGFFHSVEVGFEDVAMILKQKKNKGDRWILDGSIRGVAKPGRMVRLWCFGFVKMSKNPFSLRNLGW